MIASIKGRVQAKWNGALLIEIQQLGYRVFVPQRVFDELMEGEEIHLFTHHHLREDAQELYGFRTLEDLEFFEQLLGISGIGPKTALSALSVAKLTDLKRAILHGDPSLLTKVSGIGKKTAERVILELKNKLKMLPETEAAMSKMVEHVQAAEDATSALEQLGYSQREAEAMIEQLPASLGSAEEKIREALRRLGTKVRS